MPGSSRRAWARFALKAVALAGALALLVGGFEQRSRRIPTSFALKRAGLEAALPGLKALVLGPSVALNAVDPCRWRLPAYNLANNGQSLYYDAALFRQVQARAPGLRALLLGLGYPSLRADLAGLNEVGRGYAYRVFFGIPHEMPEERADPRNRSAFLWLEPSKVLRWSLGLPGLALSRLDACGFEALPALSPEQQELQLGPLPGARAVDRHAQAMRRDPSYGLGILRGILDDAAAQQLRVALFIPPFSAAYAQALKDPRWDQDRAALRALAAEKGAWFKDYSTDPRFGDADFADVDHLAAVGAARFTDILARESPLNTIQ